MAPYCDVITLKTDTYIPDINTLKDISDFMKIEFPNHQIAYNYPSLVDPNINQDHVRDELIHRRDQLANLGFVWQALALSPLQAAAISSDHSMQQKYQKEIYGFSELNKQNKDRDYDEYCGKFLGELNRVLYPSQFTITDNSQFSNLNGQQNVVRQEDNKRFGDWGKNKLGFGHITNKVEDIHNNNWDNQSSHVQVGGIHTPHSMSYQRTTWNKVDCPKPL